MRNDLIRLLRVTITSMLWPVDQLSLSRLDPVMFSL